METLVVFEEYYRGKKVLVTGDTGFKGSWLCVWLTSLGAEVAGYALAPPTEQSLFQDAGLSRQVDHVEGDIRDEGRLRSVIASRRPDVIFHLAAQPLVLDSYQRPVETFEVNVIGTIRLLEAVRLEQHECSIVVVSTDKCYENNEWLYGYREIDSLGGHDPYSASKAAMEIAVRSFRRSFFFQSDGPRVRLATARAGNVVGGGDWSANRIVPDIARALHREESIIVRNPNSVRPWQHVLEPLAGYLWLAARLAKSHDPIYQSAWNFGPVEHDAHTVREVVEAAIAVWGNGSWSVVESGEKGHEASLLRLSIDKASSLLGWVPVWTFPEAMERTILWYRRTMSNPEASALQMCVDDIERFERSSAAKTVAWSR